MSLVLNLTICMLWMFFLKVSILTEDKWKHTQGVQHLCDSWRNKTNTHRQTQIEHTAAQRKQISLSKPNSTISSQRSSITDCVTCQLVTKRTGTTVCFLLFLWDLVLQLCLEASWQLVSIHFAITHSRQSNVKLALSGNMQSSENSTIWCATRGRAPGDAGGEILLNRLSKCKVSAFHSRMLGRGSPLASAVTFFL